MSKILLLDMDGIIADFNRHSIRVYNEIYNAGLDESKCNEYVNDHEVVDPTIDKKKLRSPFKDPGFFVSCPAIPGAQEAVEKLEKWFDIYVVTTHYWGNPTCVHEKELWLMRYFPSIADRGIFTKHKYQVHGDILVDDRNTNVEKWKNYWLAQGRKPVGASLAYPWTDKKIVDLVDDTWPGLADKIINHFHGR